MTRRRPQSYSSQLVVLSDLHAGCQTALCPPAGARLDSGGIYTPGVTQAKLWPLWQDFRRWIRQVTQGQRFDLLMNGDAIDGVHHDSTTQWSHNIGDQVGLAYDILKPLVDACRASGGTYYHVRGTEAHVGKEGEHEERLARLLGAKPAPEGQYARHALWYRMAGPNGPLIHALHHIGSTGSSAYEATAVHKELDQSYVEAGRWGVEPPSAIVRSHRHRYLKTEIGAASGKAFAIVTPAWQGKTTFSYRIPGARLSESQYGGVVLKISDDEGLYSRSFVRVNERPMEEH